MHHVNQLDLVWENIVCISIEAQRMTHNIVKNVLDFWWCLKSYYGTE